jgi:hypothetical protein
VVDPGPAETILGTAVTAQVLDAHARATLTINGGFTVGAHALAARYLGNDVRAPSTGTLALVVTLAETFVNAYGPGSAEAHTAVQLEAQVGSPTDAWVNGATMTFRRVGGGNVCVMAVAPTNVHYCTIPALPAGTTQYEAVYSGNAVNAGSTSPPITIVATPDTVRVSNVKTNSTSIYPYRDGYRDTVTMSGSRLEPLSVAIRVYSPTGSLVRGVTLARASGAYAYSWNGRNAAGTMLTVGKYRIVQTLTDAFSTVKSWTSYVTLSSKRLVTKTVYVTKAGSSVSAKGDPGNGSITISTAGGYAKLTGQYPSGWVGVGYQFTLPSAAIYKSIRFEVYSKGPRAVPPKNVGAQNFHTCPLTSGAWDEGCFDHWSVLGSTGTVAIWQGANASVTTNRAGRTVRVMVSVQYSTQTVYKARVKVVYGILV